MPSRQFSWRELVIRANPEHNRESRYVIEYEFSAPARRSGDERVHEGDRRVFRGLYEQRGAYAPETVVTGGLTWGGIPIDWNGQPLTWGDE